MRLHSPGCRGPLAAAWRRAWVGIGLVLLVAPAVTRGQDVLFEEQFDNGCTSLCLASNHPNWSVVATGTNGTFANQWYVSCAENGEPSGSCGAGCGSDGSLHVGNVPGSPAAGSFCPPGDCGAAYDASNANSIITNRRAQSPIIPCTNHQGIVLQFDLIGYGEPGADYGDVQYSSDGGTSWISLTGGVGLTSSCCCSIWDCYFDGCCSPETAPCGADALGADRQGKWEQRSIALPATADNNPNVRIGFNWTNDRLNGGHDPSVAIDGVKVTGCGTSPIPMDLGNHLRAARIPGNIRLDWSLMTPQPPTSHFHVFRSTSPSSPFPGSWTQLASHAPPLIAETFNDPALAGGDYYYDVRSADDCERNCPKPMNVSATSTSPSCNGTGFIQFNSQISGGQPPFTYVWNFGDLSPNGTTANPSHVYAYPPHSYTVTLNVTDSTPPFPQTSQVTLPARVGPGDLAVTTTDDSPKPVNEPVNFTSSPTGGVAPYTFAWDFDDGSAGSAAQNPQHAYAVAGIYAVTVRVTDSRGCAVTSAPMTVTITLP